MKRTVKKILLKVTEWRHGNALKNFSKTITALEASAETYNKLHVSLQTEIQEMVNRRQHVAMKASQAQNVANKFKDLLDLV